MRKLLPLGEVGVKVAGREFAWRRGGRVGGGETMRAAGRAGGRRRGCVGVGREGMWAAAGRGGRW